MNAKLLELQSSIDDNLELSEMNENYNKILDQLQSNISKKYPKKISTMTQREQQDYFIDQQIIQAITELHNNQIQHHEKLRNVTVELKSVNIRLDKIENKHTNEYLSPNQKESFGKCLENVVEGFCIEKEGRLKSSSKYSQLYSNRARRIVKKEIDKEINKFEYIKGCDYEKAISILRSITLKDVDFISEYQRKNWIGIEEG